MAARLFLGRLPVISSVRVVIKDSSMPVSGMAGTAGLTEGRRWNNAAAGCAWSPVRPGRSNVIQGHVRVGQGSKRNPLLDGIHAGLRQAKAPGPESPVGIRYDLDFVQSWLEAIRYIGCGYISPFQYFLNIAFWARHSKNALVGQHPCYDGLLGNCLHGPILSGRAPIPINSSLQRFRTTKLKPRWDLHI